MEKIVEKIKYQNNINLKEFCIKHISYRHTGKTIIYKYTQSCCFVHSLSMCGIGC